MKICVDRINEKSSKGFQCGFRYQDGTVPTITAMTWTLTDHEGNVINSREDVTISSPTADELIVLSGDDLQIVDDARNYEKRILLIEATYSDGSTSLPVREEIVFYVYNSRSM